MSSSEEDSATSRSISRSPSPALSLEQEQEQQDTSPPTLARLVLYFVSAKRSLASTTHVYRANELVTHSRSLIEEIATLNGKNGFARKGLHAEIDTLASIRDTIRNEDEQNAVDFQSKVLNLDAAHERLSRTLEGLKGSIVASHIPSSGKEEEEGKDEDEIDEEQEKTLYDFIDAEKHESLISSIRSGIDTYHLRRNQDAALPLEEFSSKLQSFTTALTTKGAELQTSSLKPASIYSRKPRGASEGISTLFNSLTEDAQTLASLLSQLVSHYDLCVSALKHTEGGGEAARLAVDDAPADDSLYAKAYQPMDEQEREAMLRVLVADAEEVEDVVSEMAELGQGMESSYDELFSRAERCRSEYQGLGKVHSDLKLLRTGVVPSCLQTTSHFYRTLYVELAADLQGQTEALVDLVQFYDEFQRGYGRLLKEVRRREVAAERMRSVAEKAQRELDRLFDADREAREEFVDDVGGYIPRDLGARFGMEEKGLRYVVGEED